MDNKTIYEIDFDKVKITYHLPFSNHNNGGLMAIALLYAFLFVVGTCGNAATLAVVYHVRSVDPRTRQNTTLTYICVLSIIDFISMLPLPMTIIDQILGFWMFGTAICKLFRLFEHSGKIFSTFILVCFSIDRYCGVCHPLKVELRKTKTAYFMLTFMFCITCIMLCPIVIFAQSKEIILQESYNKEKNEITRLHLFKCADNLDNKLFILFSLTCFFFAYLIPLLMMIFFYFRMLLTLFEKNRMIQRRGMQTFFSRKSSIEERIPVTRIATYTLLLCLFHFLCWTPYWTSVLYLLYLEIFPPAEFQMPNSSFIYFMYGVHALPYINSASNFILYGLLNRQLSQSCSKKYSNVSRKTQRRLIQLQADFMDYNARKRLYDDPPSCKNLL
ncbi:7 transmembrane receptor (rhodopsin family) protein [Acanthocheilonema viteae]